MHGSTIKDAWTQARLEHFTAGRVLVNSGRFQSGFLLLAYSVEFSYKQLISAKFLYESNAIQKEKERRTILKSHDLLKLHQYTVTHELLSPFGDIEKLLTYLNNVSTRYPSGILSKRKEGIYAKGVGVDDIPYVDDLIVELDYQIFKIDNESSIYGKALGMLRIGFFGEFFAGNIHIDRYLKEYIGILEPEEQKFITENFTSKTLFELPNTDFGKLQVAASITDDNSVTNLKANMFRNRR